MKCKIHDWGSEGKRFLFYCPGCETHHAVPIEGMTTSPVRWNWNGDTERPTLTPSLLTTHGKNRIGTCHLFITDGNIQFLGDCEHQYVGQTIPLPNLNETWGE